VTQFIIYCFLYIANLILSYYRIVYSMKNRYMIGASHNSMGRRGLCVYVYRPLQVGYRPSLLFLISLAL